MFAAIGRFDSPDSTRYEVRWDKGELSGDPPAVETVKEWAQVLEGLIVGPGDGPYTTTNHLSSGVSTVCILQYIMIDPLFIGDVPQRDVDPTLP